MMLHEQAKVKLLPGRRSVAKLQTIGARAMFERARKAQPHPKRIEDALRSHLRGRIGGRSGSGQVDSS
jgi:hypothetical protein